jgi:transcriptional regulator with GAF, ATPase, and Fis domain
LVNVPISGESGTGKDLIAKAVHYSSLRARRPFVALNCAALPESLVESELFGIEKGVATGVSSRPGHFETADRGTLFLDEIGDLSLTAQAKILRVLEARVVERVGGRTSIPVDVRVLAATNKDLEAGFRKGTLREDLYYRLKVIHIRMPSLREIREDVPLLANRFLAECCRDSGRQLEFSPGVLRRLTMAEWPGQRPATAERDQASGGLRAKPCDYRGRPLGGFCASPRRSVRPGRAQGRIPQGRDRRLGASVNRPRAAVHGK